MRGVNKVILIGNMGQDPDVKTLQSGTTVANCSLATSSVWTDSTGQRNEKVEWHRLVMFNRLAEIAGQYLRKGAPVYVEGALQTRKWEKEGHAMYSTEIIVREMHMLGKREDNPSISGNSPHASPGYQTYDKSRQQTEMDDSYNQNAHANTTNNPQGNTRSGNTPAPSGSFDDFDDDIPF